MENPIIKNATLKLTNALKALKIANAELDNAVNLMADRNRKVDVAIKANPHIKDFTTKPVLTVVKK